MPSSSKKYCSREARAGRLQCQYHAGYAKQGKLKRVAQQRCRSCPAKSVEGRLSCQKCPDSEKLRNQLMRDAKSQAVRSWEGHCHSANDTFEEAHQGLPKAEFMDLMYPDGPDGPRATCVWLVVVDGVEQLCGDEGTVNRLKSEVRSCRSERGQICNVLCRRHNSKWGSRTITGKPDFEQQLRSMSSSSS